MADRYTHVGKQVFDNGRHIADGATIEDAAALVEQGNGREPWDDEDIVSLMSDAMTDAQDMDTGMTDLARASLAALKREGLLA